MAPRKNTTGAAAQSTAQEGEVFQPGEDGGAFSNALQAMSETQSLAMNLMKAEVDQQVATAKRYPRSITEAQRRIESLATLDAEAAASCVYALERRAADGTKTAIIGPSIRFAEMVQQAWHNCRVAARVTDVGKDAVEATGVFYDLEANTAVAKSSRRRITTKSGARFGDDMINVTANAAASIALRNAILAGIPRAVWGRGFEKALSVTRGTQETLEARKAAMVQAFKAQGATQPQVWALLGVKGAADVTLDHMVLGAAMLNKLADESTTLDELLAEAMPEQQRKPEGIAGANGGGAAPAPKAAQPAGASQGPAAGQQQATTEQESGAAAGRAGNVAEQAKPEQEKPAQTEPMQQQQPAEEAKPQETAQDAPAAETGTTPAAEGGQASPDAPQDAGGGDEDQGGGDDEATDLTGQGDQSEAQDEEEEEVPAPQAILDLVAQLEGADWPKVREAVQAIHKTTFWQEATDLQKNAAFAMAWSQVTTLPAEGRPNPSKDPGAFRLFLAWCRDPEEIERKWSDLVGSAAYGKMPEAGRNGLIADKRTRKAQLAEQQKED